MQLLTTLQCDYKLGLVMPIIMKNNISANQLGTIWGEIVYNFIT
jgi:hypothetical protein